MAAPSAVVVVTHFGDSRQTAAAATTNAPTNGSTDSRVTETTAMEAEAALSAKTAMERIPAAAVAVAAAAAPAAAVAEAASGNDH